MFTYSLNFLGNDDQAKEWVPKVNYLNILGAYAQTELAHGTNVQGIETTATLDKTTDEFVIHTPSIAAYKFWPGTLGIHGTHATVFAQMIIDGDNCGVQAFMVPLRSLETHELFPGVDCGDIGPKLGYQSMDNGYLGFNHYRIPRENLLSRFIYVDKEGTVEMKGDPRALYSILVATRVAITHASFIAIARSALISIRYAVCRR